MYAKNIIVCCLLVNLCYSQEYPCVETKLGKIKGHYRVSNSGKKYEAYEGIPYALPPIDDRRFLPPEPITPWQGELEATKFRDLCIGLLRTPAANDSSNYVTGIEDCLYLNVYAQIENADVPLPVIIWIYGGGFQYSGLTDTQQNYFIDHNLVFISFNYRHVSLGFLSTEDEVVSGNMGLKDQAAVIKWVSENIDCFGGDPNKITLIGLSAGGASVHYHYFSPISQGLFCSGISSSGTVFDPWAQAKNSREKAIKLGELMNCSIDDMTEMVNCLRSRPARDLVAAQAYFMPWHFNEFSPFGPVLEKNTKNPFIDRSPIDIINSGDVYDAPWITGVVSEEGLYPAAEFVGNTTAFEDLDKNWNAIAPHLLQYYYTIPKKGHAGVAKRIRNHYFAKEPITQDNFYNLTHLVGDRLFVTGAEKAARAQAGANDCPVWFYFYSYRAANSYSEIVTNTTINFGVSHGDDVHLVLEDAGKTDKDLAMHQDLMRFWLSVVQDGAPDFGPKWTPINESSMHFNYLHMIEPDNFREEANDNFGEKLFWQSIDFNENKPSRRIKKQN